MKAHQSNTDIQNSGQYILEKIRNDSPSLNGKNITMVRYTLKQRSTENIPALKNCEFFLNAWAPYFKGSCSSINTVWLYENTFIVITQGQGQRQLIWSPTIIRRLIWKYKHHPKFEKLQNGFALGKSWTPVCNGSVHLQTLNYISDLNDSV